MKDGKIHIRAKQLNPNNQGLIKLTPEAARLLADVATEAGRSMRATASEIITQAIQNDLVVFDREGL